MYHVDDIDSPEFGVKRPDNRNQVSNRRPTTTTTTTERSGKIRGLQIVVSEINFIHLRLVIQF